LFGEHQDYLNLPVIACAISKRIHIEGYKRSDKKVIIHLPDINLIEDFDLSDRVKYSTNRDYLKSSINVLQRNGYDFSNGFECVVNGNIPINAGASSSTALVVAWISFLLGMTDQKGSLSEYEIAQLAHEAEVIEFLEPGGMMDHFSISFGGMIFIDFNPQIKITNIKSTIDSFILGNSKEIKETTKILANVKNILVNISKTLSSLYRDFSLVKINLNEIDQFQKHFSNDEFCLLKGTIRNRDITRVALKELMNEKTNKKRIGELLNEHQAILREELKISTPKIDRMIDSVLNAGAYGAKINGSGGGGCMFAYASENNEKVLDELKKIASESYIVNIDSGVQIEYS